MLSRIPRLAVVTLCTLAVTACGGGSSAAVVTGHAALSGKALFDGETDHSGIVIALTGPTTGATVTDAGGNYTFGALLTGSYAVVATAPGALQASAVTTLHIDDGTAAVASPLHFTASGSISGRAIAGGANNAGILVLVAGTAASAVTDDAGNYHLSNVPTGAHDLIATLPGLGGAKVSGVIVKRGVDTAVANLSLSSQPVGAGSISGRVLLSGKPAPAGLAIAVQGPIASATITATDGSYSFANLPHGQYVATAVVRSTDAAAQVLAVQIEAGEPHPNTDFHLTSLGLVRGTANFSGAATGNAGITVAVVGSLAVTVTNDAGLFELVGVPSGTQDVLAAYPGYLSATSAVPVIWDAQATAPTLSLSSRPGPQGTISGHATFAGLADSSGILVTATGPGAAGAITSAGGDFTLSGLADGTYILNASAANTAERVLSRSVVITGGEPVAGKDFAFTPTGVIEGLVTVDGTAQAGVLVYAEGTTDSAFTDSAGHYQLPDVAVGVIYNLRASSNGRLSPAVQVTPVSQGAHLTAATLVISNLG